jgi:hypothetical protein
MLDIDALIKKLQDSTTGNVTVNIINVTSDTTVDDDTDDEGIYTVKLGKRFVKTNFQVGMRVDVCHLKKDGSGTKHTTGTVDSFGTDDFGDYVRVTGDNGNHYRCGLKLDQERKGSKIFRIL